MRHITLIATGGTIASLRQSSGAKQAALSGAALRATLPPEMQAVRVKEFAAINGFSIDFDFVLRLAAQIEQCLAEPHTKAVVVTQGTDTLEEVAFLLELLLRPQAPVIITGAQRAADDKDPDGPHNLADAIQVAALPQAEGVLVCFAGTLHAAREVAKTHADGLKAFSSPNLHPLATKGSDQTWTWQDTHARIPRALHAAVQPLMQGAARFASDVFLLTATLADSGVLVQRALSAPARGLVIEGFGVGDTTPAMAQAIKDGLARGIPIAITSRCAAGAARPVYGGAGGGHELAQAGALFAHTLSGVKLRLLMSALRCSPPTHPLENTPPQGETTVVRQ